jgi:hypothetical protein
MPPEKDKTPKSRVAVRLKEAVGAAKARNKSADLLKLKEQYLAFTKKLKNLTVVLKNHHQQMTELAKTRLAVRWSLRVCTEAKLGRFVCHWHCRVFLNNNNLFLLRLFSGGSRSRQDCRTVSYL